MPTISCDSKLRAVVGKDTLLLTAKQLIVVGQPSDTVYAVNRSTFPQEVDILPSTSELILVISGRVNRSQVSTDTILASDLGRYLRQYFICNATELGLATVSKLVLGDCGRPRLALALFSKSGLRTSPNSPTSCILSRVILQFSYNRSASLSEAEDVASAQSPLSQNGVFANKLSLAWRAALDKMLGQFCRHLVKQYPLLFGRWRMQLDTEHTFFAPLYQSITSIISRSTNPAFQSSCNVLFKRIRMAHRERLSSSCAALSSFLDSIPDRGEKTTTKISNADAFVAMMDFIYRRSMRRLFFKGSEDTFSYDNGESDSDILTQVNPAADNPREDVLKAPTFEDRDLNDEGESQDLDLGDLLVSDVDSEVCFEGLSSPLGQAGRSISAGAHPDFDILPFLCNGNESNYVSTLMWQGGSDDAPNALSQLDECLVDLEHCNDNSFEWDFPMDDEQNQSQESNNAESPLISTPLLIPGDRDFGTEREELSMSVDCEWNFELEDDLRRCFSDSCHGPFSLDTDSDTDLEPEVDNCLWGSDLSSQQAFEGCFELDTVPPSFFAPLEDPRPQDDGTMQPSNNLITFEGEVDMTSEPLEWDEQSGDDGDCSDGLEIMDDL